MKGQGWCRCTGEAIPIHNGPTPDTIAEDQRRAHADGLAGRVCAAAADAARCQYVLLELLAEFDAMNAMRYWRDFKSLAHWLSWCCSMTPGVAREHVRVAKALRRMPTIAGLFRQGKLSYSKAREVTRVVDVVDEHRLAELALTATASQLARMIAAFRSADGMRIGQQAKRNLSWHEREDGMIDFWARQPKEEAAVLLAAIEAAKEQFGPPPAKPDPCGEESDGSSDAAKYNNPDGLVDVARVFLNTSPEDRSGEDRSLVVVQVSAENLARNVPAGTPEARPAGVDPAGSVRAGTSSPESAACHIDRVGSIEPETAQRLACDSALLGAVIDKHGDVLALSRTPRLVSKALRRALMIRDKMCRYPGCHQIRHLEAHHVVPWILGGPTDLDNLILLCRWHHTAVHEGRVNITRHGKDRVFTKPDGQPCDWWVDEKNLARHLDFALRRRQQLDQLATVDSFQHPDAQTIRPRWAGEPFDVHSCVQALFTIKLPKQAADAHQQAA